MLASSKVISRHQNVQDYVHNGPSHLLLRESTTSNISEAAVFNDLIYSVFFHYETSLYWKSPSIRLLLEEEVLVPFQVSEAKRDPNIKSQKIAERQQANKGMWWWPWPAVNKIRWEGGELHVDMGQPSSKLPFLHLSFMLFSSENHIQVLLRHHLHFSDPLLLLICIYRTDPNLKSTFPFLPFYFSLHLGNFHQSNEL